MKKNKFLIFILCFLLCFVSVPAGVRASDGEEYVTISVDAADDNSNLKYALDTDDPAAFTDSNEFTVPAKTSHTIYVKDVAGNITSQTYTPSTPKQEEPDMSGGDAKEQRINIDLEIGGKSERNSEDSDYADYDYLTDDPIAPGTGTVAEKVKTDTADDAERIFYTFTTKEGNVLYLVIDQSQSTDNVYLLDTVSVDDLQVLANGKTDASDEKEDNLLAALSKETEKADMGEKDSSVGGSSGNLFLIVTAIIIAGGLYYYFKIYKKKKDESMDVIDAMDMDEFEPEEQEEEELEFELNDAEKEKYLEDLINEDENLYDIDPDEYATSHMDDDYDMEAELQEIDDELPDMESSVEFEQEGEKSDDEEIAED